MKKKSELTKTETFSPWWRKTLFYMKLTNLLLLISAFQTLAAVSWSQTATLSLKIQNAAIKDVLQKIEDQSDYYFLYSSKVIDVERKVNVNMENVNIEKILSGIFMGTTISYKIDGRLIVLQDSQSDLPGLSLQNLTITGSVKNSSGESLPGVTIAVKGASKGTVSDSNGNFNLTNVADDATLVLSFVGMRTQEIKIDGRTSIQVVLEEETIGLEEVVAIGYGTQKKSTLTGSVSTVKPEEIKSIPATNMSQLVTGRLAGVITRQPSGNPGKDQAEIRIRGASGALVVVDGIIGRDFNSIDPNDIESLSVLKDASATAVYGARAQNGVILVTTKRGQRKDLELNYNAYVGFQKPTREPDFFDIKEKWIRDRRYSTALGIPDTWNQDYFDKIGTDPDGLTDQVITGRNWGNENYRQQLLKNAAMQTQHNLSVSGGNQRSSFYASFGYFNQEGMFKTSITKYNRYSLRSNFDTWFLDENLKVSFDMFGQYGDGNYPSSGDAEIWERLYDAISTRPLMFSNGKYTSQSGNDNVKAELDPAHGYLREDRRRFNSSLQFDLKIPFIKGLSVKALAAYDYYNNFDKYWNVDLPLYDLYDDTEGNVFSKPELRQTNNSGYSLNFETHVQYLRSFGVHNFSALMVYSQNESNRQWFDAYKKNYITPALDQLFMGENSGQSNTGYEYDEARQGIVGRLTYDYKGKYLLETNFRYDGSMNFPKGDRWGFFPSIAVGYRISEEPFFQSFISSDIVNNLKIRLSYGKIGNDNVGVSFPYLATYTLSDAYVLGSSQTIVKGARENELPSFDITWEETKSFNGGMEAGLFQNKLLMEIDFFYNKTTGILLSRSDQSSTLLGKSFPKENIGIQRRGGFDYKLSYFLKKRNFDLELGHTFSYWSSLWEYMDENTGQLEIPNWRETQASPSYGVIWSADGYYQSYEEVMNSPRNMSYNLLDPGYIKYKDMNGDGKIDSYDKKRLGKPTFPQIQVGLTFRAGYKGFEFSGLFVGATMYNKMLSERLRAGMHGITYKEHDNLWTPETPNAKYPRQGEYRTGNNYETSNFWLRDASYLRLKNLEFGYDFRHKLIKSRNIQAFRMYLSGTNLFTITNLEIIDPELGSDQGSGYPLMQVYSLGLNVIF